MARDVLEGVSDRQRGDALVDDRAHQAARRLAQQALDVRCLFGITINIMSLAGIAISIGVLVDGAIVEV